MLREDPRRGGLSGSEPQVGVDSAGNAVITWLAGDGATDRIQARTLTPAVLSDRCSTPELAANGVGAAVMVWSSVPSVGVAREPRRR